MGEASTTVMDTDTTTATATAMATLPMLMA